MNLQISDIIAQMVLALKAIRPLAHYHNDIGANVFLNKQWFDRRDSNKCPELSLFVLEETLLESKGNCYKQELTIHVEGFLWQNSSEKIYLLAADVKRALLGAKFPFGITYHGYEINLPDDGASVMRVQVKFKVIYFENIG